ncbi:type IV secretion system protein, partial [Salmonella enterica subsp. enterica serovar Montevideo]|nr:type IV secretion system protein [Salmonella enterica subsp. enterica serovar Montevideo]
MDVQVAQTLFDAIDNAAKTQMNNVTAVMAVMGVVFGAFWMIYILLRSLEWYFQGLTQVIQDVLLTIFKASCILFMAFSVSWYVSTIVPTVTQFPVWLGNTMAGVSGDKTNLVDGLISSFFDAVVNTIDAMKFEPISNFKATVLGILALVLLLVGGIPFLLVAVGTLITLKAASMLLLVVGPIFIALSLFPATRQYFWGWVGVLGGFTLAQALFAVVIGLEMSFINANVVKGGEIETDLMSCLSILLYFGAFTLLATEIPNYAASVMGGSPSGGVTGVGGLLSK